MDELHKACSLKTTIHYFLDFAQQIHFASNPMQSGRIHFKTTHNCGIFGVMCEATPRQVNYLIEEASDVGKGANTTISYVHHYLQNHRLGKTQAHLHADNYSGQNKNNNCYYYFIWCLAWRTIPQWHDYQLLFLITGHTKFGADCCFGIIKRAYKVRFVSYL